MNMASRSRRKFLKESIAGFVVLSSARAFPAMLLSPGFGGPAAEPLRFFSQHEHLLIRTIADRIVGERLTSQGGGEPIDVAGRADQFLSTADPEVQEQIHLLLTVFNSPLFTFLFDLRFSSFLSMTPDGQDSYLQDWMLSRLAFRRTGFQALKRLCVSMYYTDKVSWDAIGYSGMFLPEDLS